MDESVRENQNQPRVSEAQLASIVASATDAIVSTNTAQQIILFNHSAEAMFLRSAEETLGKPIDTLIPERFRHGHRRYVEQFGESGITMRSMQAPGQLVGLRGNGEEFPIEAMISHATTEEGRIFTVIIRDVTERVRMEKAREEFLAMLGHELRNPLGAISNAVAVARLQSTDDVMLRPLDILDRQVRHMARLVNDLVDMSRVTQGQMDLQIEDVDMGLAVEDALQTVLPHIERNQQHVHVSLPKERVVLEGDSVRLHQVLVNIIENASKYTDAGGHIEIEVKREGSIAVVCVRDTGQGITPDLMPRIFEPFVQGRQQLDRAHGGLGIGLALVRRIIALHGGSIEAHSKGEGEGSEFMVRLPLLRPRRIAE